jgi:rRNA maturation endonuclease Nob1
MGALPIEDMSKTYLEHSMVVHNFVADRRIKPTESTNCHICNREVSNLWNFCPRCGNQRLKCLGRDIF